MVAEYSSVSNFDDLKEEVSSKMSFIHPHVLFQNWPSFICDQIVSFHWLPFIFFSGSQVASILQNIFFCIPQKKVWMIIFGWTISLRQHMDHASTLKSRICPTNHCSFDASPQHFPDLKCIQWNILLYSQNISVDPLLYSHVPFVPLSTPVLCYRPVKPLI